MSLVKRIFSSRISGKPINIDFKDIGLKLVNELLKYEVLRVDISQPHNLTENQLVFRLNDSVLSNGAEYSIGQRILFSDLNINGIVQVSED